MRLGNGDGRVFQAVLDEYQPPTVLQGTSKATENLLRMLQLVVDVNEQRQLDGVGRKSGVRLGALHDHDIGQSFDRSPLAYELKQARLDISGIHGAGGAD